MDRRALLKAAGAVVGAGLVWSALCAQLAAKGEVPSGPSPLPVEVVDWYAAQAKWVVPVLVAQWGFMAWVAQGAAEKTAGQGTFAATAAGIGVGWGLPLGLALFVELVVYTVAGMEGLRSGLPLVAPLALAGCLYGTARGLKQAHGFGWEKAAPIALLALMLGAVLGGPFLR